jgi:D-methionine transport system permease protein
MIEQSLAEVPRDTLESVVSFGASMPRIVLGALLPEALPSIVRGVSITLISVLGYTAIAGAVGAGGLGDIAIRYGYYRYEDEVMVVTVVLLIVLVQVIQRVCDLVANHIDHR